MEAIFGFVALLVFGGLALVLTVWLSGPRDKPGRAALPAGDWHYTGEARRTTAKRVKGWRLEQTERLWVDMDSGATVWVASAAPGRVVRDLRPPTAPLAPPWEENAGTIPSKED